MTLTTKEKLRYDRQIRIPEFGLASQEKLKGSAVALVGCGGLGAPILQYLVAAGVGTIGLIDDDEVSLSNLQRQVIFKQEDVGKNKLELAAEYASALNENVNIRKYSVRLSSENALGIFEPYDLIIDGSDNFPTRYLVNDACEILGKAFVSGAIYRFEGQVSLFNHRNGPTYRDLFPSPPSEEMAPNCATAGVIGVVAGIVGTLMANESIKFLIGLGDNLSGKLLLVDTMGVNFRKISIRALENRPRITELIDYELFCSGVKSGPEEIEYQDFLILKESFQLIDVREPEEFELQNIGGYLIPLGELESRVNEISREGLVVLHCQSGQRSARAIRMLQEKFGFENLVNLKGGLNAARP
ncbi:ThiF family adenylyltransferase [Marinilongibacter aquaticus]|uniref:ThiF family adenylyltransferase n=1 Tax=Marinilongibacter aquaticus TaxID=2975157 RepID=UPI0021BD0E10|nr:ThiF family adenylyltransferase [Marinilongibacter aquaticus]UBM57612.1 ThiF family adenylyltransferase [Marinilongibacter aquaticus]